MSFTDLERGLSTPPLSPTRLTEQNGKDFLGSSYTTKSSFPGSLPVFASSSPPVKLPSGLQVTRGNSRDSIGLNLQPHVQKNPHGHSPYPPPVSPNRKANPMAHHSRFLQDNTRIDTPRPTLTPSTVAAVNAGIEPGSATAPVAVPRSPHTTSPVYLDHQNSNRIIGDHRAGDMGRRQVLSPPISPHQFSPTSSPLNQQYRGFIRVGNRMTSVSGATHASSNHDCLDNRNRDNVEINSNEAVIDISADDASSSSPTTFETRPTAKSWSPAAIPPSSSSIKDQEHDYDLMVRHISQQIFNISSNIAVLERLVPCLGQRHKDTVEMRASLHAVLNGTQDLVKSAHGLVKVLAKYHQPPSSAPQNSIGIRAQPARDVDKLSSWQRKILASRRQTHQRLTKDLTLVSKSFQDLQRQVVEAKRQQVATLRRLSSSASLRRLSNRRSDLMDLSAEDIEAGALAELGGNSSNASGINNGSGDKPYIHDRELSVQEEALLREILAMDGELVFHETLLQERESEIRKIEEGMGQVLDVMKELGTLVHEQRAGVDFLHDNIAQTRGRIQQGHQEVLKASEHQRRSREKLCYMIMVTSIVGAIVMLAFID
ncbi:hypothetical protein BG011_010273 [Mortierella polycephala]|uniref:t-SNARE coiled-coil homology domain-containing protein n=1 Tax=Mortierella polycephala TaxID=41804 RepID=A0A9P6PMV4_9FUNG|nr:hypothetical protein BG011_010273 [Mortierella polycephala]